MKIIIIRKALAMFLLCLFASSLSAAPRVVVSLAPLHSLVASLMEGVAEPTLLLQQDAASGEALDAFQKSRLLTADMVVWSGAGLEKSIARTLEGMPLLENKLLTLSNYVPLLGRADAWGPVESRQLSRELGFWNDPRLAIMAVRMLTPRLVRLDPDNQEIYLDNEIGLLKRLKGLEKAITRDLSGYDAASPRAIAALDPYFRHRFIPASLDVSDTTGGYRRVADGGECSGLAVESAEIQPGPAYYREFMQQTAKTLAACMWRTDKGRSVAGPVTGSSGES